MTGIHEPTGRGPAMRRMLVLLVGMALSLPVFADPAFGGEVGYTCKKADIERVIYEAAPRTNQNSDLQKSFDNCQFRFYDDNDDSSPGSPEIPHVFSEDEWFLGGILYWLYRDDLESMNLNRKQAKRLLNQAEDRLFWGRSGATLTELRVVESDYRIVHDPSYDWLIINHRYHVFKPGSLAPGTYEWRWEARSPDDPEGFVVTGSVTVTDA